MTGSDLAAPYPVKIIGVKARDGMSGMPDFSLDDGLAEEFDAFRRQRVAILQTGVQRTRQFKFATFFTRITHCIPAFRKTFDFGLSTADDASGFHVPPHGEIIVF